jgi:hypothetical protein
MTTPVECRSAPNNFSFAFSFCFLKSSEPEPKTSGAMPILSSSKSGLLVDNLTTAVRCGNNLILRATVEGYACRATHERFQAASCRQGKSQGI